MKVLYHATSYENILGIMDKGIEARNIEGLVYLCEKSDDAAKFLAIRGCKNIITFKVKIKAKDYDKLIETFDHNYRFFKCRAFGYMGNIPPEDVTIHLKYEL